MDLFGLIPIVPPSLPGERSSSLTAAQRFVAGCASGLLPAINFLVVLLVAIAAHPVIALAVMPLASATLVFLLCRRVATPIAWAIVIAAGSGAFCLVGNSCAVLLHALARLFHDL